MKKPAKRVTPSKALNTFHVADIFLLIFMAILMIQTAHNLFFNEINKQESTAIDVVVRTTSAAIFGYFISSNFRSGKKTAIKQNKNEAFLITNEINDESKAPKAKIGFSTQPQETQLQTGYAQGVRDDVPQYENKGQIIIIAVIGIICLILMLFARNYAKMSAESIATLSQLRDFISGSVGFLMGHSAVNKTQK